MSVLTFQQFVASKIPCANISERLGLGDDTGSGLIYADRCYIQITDSMVASRGSYYLLIERDDWFSDDLARLEKILWAYHYLWDGDGAVDKLHKTRDDLREFFDGWCFARGYDASDENFAAILGAAEQWTPRAASQRIDESMAELARASKPEIRQLLVLSTAHISLATHDILEALDPQTEWPCCGGTYGPYGWSFYCAESNDGVDADHIPDDLFTVMTFARSLGCDNVLLDRDGRKVDGLATYEW